MKKILVVVGAVLIICAATVLGLWAGGAFDKSGGSSGGSSDSGGSWTSDVLLPVD